MKSSYKNLKSINDLLLTTVVIESNENREWKETKTKQNIKKGTQTSKYNGTVNKINEYVGDVQH